MNIYIRRRTTFSAGLSLDPETGCPGGHDYIVEMTVCGEINTRTGMVVNIRDVDDVLVSRVVPVLGGTLLDSGTTGLESPPTPKRLHYGFGHSASIPFLALLVW